MRDETLTAASLIEIAVSESDDGLSIPACEDEVLLLNDTFDDEADYKHDTVLA